MKVTEEQITSGSDEVIVRYQKKTEEVSRILTFLESGSSRLTGILDGKEYLIRPDHILYMESVDSNTFLYTKEHIFQTPCTLAELTALFPDYGYFRCSKSMIINIYHVQCLNSLPNNRIDATMENGEHVLISRRYAKEFRQILKGDHEDEE